jgi:hypothetical protein
LPVLASAGEFYARARRYRTTPVFRMREEFEYER